MTGPLVPVPWCPICERNHEGSQCWMSPPCQNVSRAGRRIVEREHEEGNDLGTTCDECDAFTHTGADGTCDDCGAAKNDGSGRLVGGTTHSTNQVGRVWQSMLDYLNELPRIEIHENEMPADADAVVPCSLGETGCGGSEELSLMTGDPEDGYVCPWCVRVSNAAYSEYVQDVMNYR